MLDIAQCDQNLLLGIPELESFLFFYWILYFKNVIRICLRPASFIGFPVNYKPSTIVICLQAFLHLKETSFYISDSC